MRSITACEHVDQSYYCRGMCKRCYYKERDRARAVNAWVPRALTSVICGHADRKHLGRGMCRPCYSTWYEDQTKTTKYLSDRSTKDVTCGHVNSRHFGLGLCKACYSREYKKSDNGILVNREHRLKKKYGIVQADFEAMKSSQADCCAICKIEVDKLVVDHDHVTGVVRALLCNKCNIALGLMDENVERFIAAAEYIKHHSTAKVLEAVK